MATSRAKLVFLLGWGYQFRPQREIALEAYLPRWLRPKTALLLSPDGASQTLAMGHTSHHTVHLQVDALPMQVALIWIE